MQGMAEAIRILFIIACIGALSILGWIGFGLFELVKHLMF